MKSIPFERDYTLEEAFKELEAQLIKHDIKYKLDIVGEQIKTVQCSLFDRHGKFIAFGNGKGEIESAKIGSIFEATEHLFSDFNSIPTEKLTYQNSLIFYNSSNQSGKLPIELLNTPESSSIPLIPYYSVNGKETCLYPLALICPDYLECLKTNKNLSNKDKFDYSRIENYSTNSGTAIGMNKSETIIHSLLENIERYTLSEFISNTFLLRIENNLEIIDNFSLPNSIVNVLSRIQKEIKESITIFRMPNKYGVPTFCSWTSPSNFKLGIAGYGCSLSREHAMLRSLYELAQTFLLDKYIYGLQSREDYENIILTNLKHSKFHLDCAKFNLNKLQHEIGFKTIRFDEITKMDYAQTTAQYLNKLTDIIHSKGETPFACELNNFGENIKIINTFITNEDRFFNVLVGKNTFPNNFKLIK